MPRKKTPPIWPTEEELKEAGELAEKMRQEKIEAWFKLKTRHYSRAAKELKDNPKKRAKVIASMLRHIRKRYTKRRIELQRRVKSLRKEIFNAMQMKNLLTEKEE